MGSWTFMESLSQRQGAMSRMAFPPDLESNMRRFFVMMSLVALSACGGQPTEAEAPVEQTPMAEEAGPEAQSATPTCTSGDSWACYCATFKTFETCRAAQLRRCVWAYNRCSPTYE